MCVGSAASSLGAGKGPHSARVCVAKLSGEGGHSWLGHDALKMPVSTSSGESDILALQLPEATQKPEQNEQSHRYIMYDRTLVLFLYPQSGSRVITEACVYI